MFVHTVAPVVHGVGYAPWSQRAYGLKVDDEALDLFLFDGANGAQILGQYTALTGRAPLPPLWSLGLILSKAYYRTADEILAVAREVRDRGMPCDTITFDGRAWQDTDTRFAFEWDPSRYPDPAAVIAQLKALDFRICVWEYPLVSVRNPLFAELAAKGWLLKDDRTGEAYRYQWDPEPFGEVLTPLPESGLLDFTHPDAYAYWRDRHRELFEIGVDMIKPDFGEQVEPHMVASDGAQGDALHNVYALLYNRCVHEAASLYAKDGGVPVQPRRLGGLAALSVAVGRRSAGRLGRPRGEHPRRPVLGHDRRAVLRDGRRRLLRRPARPAALCPLGAGERVLGPHAPARHRRARALVVRRGGRARRRWRRSSCATGCCRTSGARWSRRARPACRCSVRWRSPVPDEPESWAFDHQFFCGDDLLVAPVPRAGAVACGSTCRVASGGASRAASRVTGGRVHELTLGARRDRRFRQRRGAVIPLGPSVQHTGALGAAPAVAETWKAA